MKKLLITVNGKRYEVEVEVLQDEIMPPPDTRAPLPRPIPPSASPVPRVSGPAAPKPVPLADDAKTLTSPINGVLLEIPVKPEQEVKENDVLCILEAMKMKTNISSPHAGKIKTILVSVGDTIEAGKPLIMFY